jgi:hypothetical protein
MLDEADNLVTCYPFPTREIHELLHAFGFAHNIEDNELRNTYWGYPYEIPSDLGSDALFPTIDCHLQTRINEKYISCLKKIYSNEEGNCSEVKFFKTCPQGNVLNAEKDIVH